MSELNIQTTPGDKTASRHPNTNDNNDHGEHDKAFVHTTHTCPQTYVEHTQLFPTAPLKLSTDLT